GFRIHSQNPPHPERGDPNFPVRILKSMDSAAAERHLVVADGLGIHVCLKNSAWRGICAHPDVATTKSHSAGVFCFGLNRFQKATVPIHQTSIIRLLLTNPKALWRHGHGVRISFRTLEQLRYFSFANW